MKRPGTVYLINFAFKKSEDDHKDLIDVLNTTFDSCKRTKSTWLLFSELSEKEIIETFQPYLSPKESLFLSMIVNNYEGVNLSEKEIQWLDSRFEVNRNRSIVEFEKAVRNFINYLNARLAF
jgi:hypothetical protein